ncbi:MAG: HAMP domain-containing histidine kinase [Clostridiales bacterium]|nr:HAMP domain-containing histidine kinase [Clostridiales bacterium]
MLKKIRWRFIGASMLAFFLVIFLLAGLVNVFNYVSVTRRADETIDFIYEYGQLDPWSRDRSSSMGTWPPMGAVGGFPDEEANYMTRFFIVAVNSENMIIGTSREYVASISEEDAAAYTNKALSRPFDRGYVDGYRYIRSQYGDATIIVFLNSSREIQYMRSLFLLTLAISAGSLLLVFVLVLFLSKKAIRPIAQNMELQKRFITDASHELKTPITSISTSLDVIEMEHGGDEWTENIRQQVGRMTGLVGEMVTLSRLDEVKPVSVKENFDLTGAVWEIIEVHIQQAKASGKTIETNIEDNVTMVGEKDSIQQMMSVLIDNAIKYSDGGEPIKISLNKVHGKVKIVVFNSCNYEKAPDTNRLFDRFYRPDESRNSATGGNGIGLAIARSVADAHGGKISAACPDGKSMTITVIL